MQSAPATSHGHKRGKLIAEYFRKNPNVVLGHVDVETRFGALNHAYLNVARWAAYYLPGVTRDSNGRWSYKGKPIRKGQGGTCVGKLEVVLRGPKGCGKSMVKKILDPLLPLLPLDQFEIVKE